MSAVRTRVDPVTAAVIAGALDSIAVEMGHKLARSEVRLPAGPLCSVGEHTVALHLHTDVDVSLIVNIVAEEQG